MSNSELLRTPSFGIEFWQNEKRCPMFSVDEILKTDRINVQMNPQPFVMRFPKVESIDVVQICASLNEKIFDQKDHPYFNPGTGGADTDYSNGWLFISDDSHNYLDKGGRLLVESDMGVILYNSIYDVHNEKRESFKNGMKIYLVVTYLSSAFPFGYEEIILNFNESKREPNLARIDSTIINVAENKRKTIKMFLASSSEFVGDRKDFEIFINRKNKELNTENIFIELMIWEDFIDAVSKTRLQDEYNSGIRQCDIFVSLFFTKVGKYTKEEFDIAHKQFLETGKPLIYTYFKNAAIKVNDIIEKDFRSKTKFLKQLNQMGHFPTYYEDIHDLKFQFNNQLKKIKDSLLNISL